MNIRRASLLPLAIAAGACSLMMFSGCGTDPESLTPSLHFQESASGCGDIEILKSNAAHTEYLLVNARRAALNLGTVTKTFDLASPPNGLLVTLDLYAYAPTYPIYCNDILSDDDPKPATWKAISGSAAITISSDSIISGQTYKAIVTLKNVTFQNAAGDQRVTLTEETMSDVLVGWYPG